MVNSDELRDRIAQVLLENGLRRVQPVLAGPDSLHSWRCEYPDRYGPCTCFDDLVDDLVKEMR